MQQSKYLSLKKLKKLPGNPRIIKDAQFKTLCNSLKANPDYFEARPLILSNRTGELIIIAGNQRYEAAKNIGLSEVPCFLIKGLTEDREREIIIRDNVANGDWNFDQLANEWGDCPLVEWGVNVPTFDKDVVPLDFGANAGQETEDISRVIVYCPDNILAAVKADIEKLKDTYSGLVFKVMEGF